MLKREMWIELKPHWIEWGNWDEGLRALPTSISKNRDCICPELSRNKNIGVRGENMHDGFFDKSFSRLTWATSPISDFGNLSYLLEPQYAMHVKALIASAHMVDVDFNDKEILPDEVYMLRFNETTWGTLAGRLDIWGSGGLRGAYKKLAIIPYRYAVL